MAEDISAAGLILAIGTYTTTGYFTSWQGASSNILNRSVSWVNANAPMRTCADHLRITLDNLKPAKET